METVAPDWEVTTRSVRGTAGLARQLGAAATPGTIVGLVGDLGAGKTTFVRAFAEGAGVLDPRAVVSPTYALMNLYPGARCELVHIDLYRLDDADSARALGLEEHILRRDAIVAVEWADKVPELLGPSAARIVLTSLGGNARRIEVWGIGKPKGVR